MGQAPRGGPSSSPRREGAGPPSNIKGTIYCSFSRSRRSYSRAALQLGKAEAPSRLYIMSMMVDSDPASGPQGPGHRQHAVTSTLLYYMILVVPLFDYSHGHSGPGPPLRVRLQA